MAPFQAQQPSVAVSKLKKIEIAINELGRTRARRKKPNFQKAGGDFLISNSDSAPPNYTEQKVWAKSWSFDPVPTGCRKLYSYLRLEIENGTAPEKLPAELPVQ